MTNRITLLLAVLITAGGLTAQITLTAENYGSLDTIRLADTAYIDTLLFDAPPATGADRVWDYSDRTLDGIADVFRERAYSNDSCFAGANATFDITYNFQGFPYPGQGFTGTDSSGRYVLGSTVTETSFSLLQVTGNPADTLTFVADKVETYDPFIQFPSTFGDSFVDTTTVTGKFELTVAAFGLNKTPGSRDIFGVTYRDIVGYGTLILPQGDGSVTEPLEALLVRDSTVDRTTYSLGGAPAPAALLGAFGLTDTTITTRVVYYFHVKGRGRTAARFSPRSGVDAGKYALIVRTVAPGTTTSVRAPEVNALTLYPNPVRAGGSLRLGGQTTITDGTLRLLDVSGRAVSEVRFQNVAAGDTELRIPASARPGLYLYQLADRRGRTVGIGRVMVR